MFNPLSKLTNKLHVPSGITDLLVGLMIGLFVLIILYVSIVQSYIQNNLTGTTQTMANIAVWFMFIAVALTAIYSAIKREE